MTLSVWPSVAAAGRVPWGHLATPMQVIYVVGVLKERLPIPGSCPPPLARLLQSCWQQQPEMRPSFADIRQVLQVTCWLMDLEDQGTASLALTMPASKTESMRELCPVEIPWDWSIRWAFHPVQYARIQDPDQARPQVVGVTALRWRRWSWTGLLCKEPHNKGQQL